MAEAWRRHDDLPDPGECRACSHCTRQAARTICAQRPRSCCWTRPPCELLIEKLHARYAAAAPREKRRRRRCCSTPTMRHGPGARSGAHAAHTVARGEVSLAPSGGRCAGGSTASFEVPAALAVEVARTCRTVGMPVDAWYFTAYAVLIRRLSWQDTFALNTIVSGRTEADCARVSGCSRCPLAWCPSAPGLSRSLRRWWRTRAVCSGPRNIPYEMFDASHAATGVAFACSTYSDDADHEVGWRVDSEHDPLIGCELGLRLQQTRAGTRANWTFDARKFAGSSIEVVQRAFVCLLAGTLRSPSIPIGQLGMLEADERQTGGYALLGPRTSRMACVSSMSYATSDVRTHRHSCSAAAPSALAS